MAMISENILKLKNHIAAICREAGRDPKDITIVGITKYSTVDQIREAVAAGIANIGENKVQQGVVKFQGLFGVTKHMVGHLQTNKAKAALETFDVIQSVDSLKLAQELERQCAKLGRRAEVLVQVNTAGEEQKSGIAPENLLDLLEQMSALKFIDVSGLMTIGPLTDDRKAIRMCFWKTKKFYDEVGKRFKGVANIKMKTLSMGMSDDYDIAIEEGANMVRIGRSIFTANEKE